MLTWSALHRRKVLENMLHELGATVFPVETTAEAAKIYLQHKNSRKIVAIIKGENEANGFAVNSKTCP